MKKLFHLVIGLTGISLMLWMSSSESAMAQTRDRTRTSPSQPQPQSAPNPVKAQPSPTGKSSSVQIDQAGGAEREVVLEEAITAQPARPLIQFQRLRSRVSFSEVRIGPTARSFFPELLKGSGVELNALQVDVIGLFPDLTKP